MDDADLNMLQEHPEWEAVLRAYSEKMERQPRPAEEESGTRWLERIAEFHGLDKKTLAAIHGKLIAVGWLRFQFEDGQAGLTYRVSPEGRQALQQIASRRTSVAEDDERTLESAA